MKHLVDFVCLQNKRLLESLIYLVCALTPYNMELIFCPILSSNGHKYNLVEDGLSSDFFTYRLFEYNKFHVKYNVLSILPQFPCSFTGGWSLLQN